MKTLRQRFRTALSFALALSASIPLLADEPEPSEEEVNAALSRGALLAMHAEWADGFRRAAIDNADSLEPFFTESVYGEWKEKTREELDETQLADFFNAAQVLVGSFGEGGAVLAFWNPFWDALLFVETGGKLSLPEGRFEESEIPLVERFAWTSGESFRGEPADAGLPRTGTVVPGPDEPLSVALWRVQRETVSRFDRLYPAKSALRTVLFRTGVESPGSEADWSRIRARSALRLRMAPMLASNRVDFAVASRCTGLLRTGALWRLRDHFRDPAHDFFCAQLAELPSQLRSEFELYGYVPTPDGTLYYFVEIGVPRLFATVTVPKDRLDRAGGPEVSMEWYDLDRAGELLDAWNEDRAEKKGGDQ